jgi:hypothetical protein
MSSASVASIGENSDEVSALQQATHNTDFDGDGPSTVPHD